MVQTKIWYLKKMDIFRGLSGTEYDLIDRDSRSVSMKKREILLCHRTAQEAVYFVKKGKIKLVKTTPDGRSLILDILGGGTLFGELEGEADYDDEEITAEAMEDSLLCMMRRQNFDRLMAVVPGLSVKITKFTQFRLKKIQNRLVDMLYCSVETRLAKTLLSLADEFGTVHPVGIIITLRLTHSDLAGLIASTRETVTCVLKEFRKRGLIDFQDRFIQISSRERLADLVLKSGS